MKWTDDVDAIFAFDKLVLNMVDDLDNYMTTMIPYLKQSPKELVMIMVTVSKFVVLYRDHRNFNPTEDLTLSFHRVLNTLAGEESTRQFGAHFIGKTVEKNFER